MDCMPAAPPSPPVSNGTAPDLADCMPAAPPSPPVSNGTAPDAEMHEAQTISGEHTGRTEEYKHHLIVDTLNFLTFFFPVYEPQFRGRPPWTLHAVMLKRVAVFLHACDLARWKPHFVMDSGYKSQEVRDKWIHRRELEITAGFRAMPYNADMLLATTLRENGADVLQPENLDADDVIARLTLHWRGVLLSGDRDMLRYVDLHGKEKRIMELFAFAPDGALVLVPRRDLVCRGTPLCALNVQLDLDLWRVAKCKTLKLVKDCAFYNRGNPDSFTRSHGNLHKLARGLRQALYAVLKARTVYETLPEWCEDTKDVKWVSTDVSGDAALAHEIRNPDLAYHWLASQEPLSCDEPSHTTAAPGRQDYRKWRSYTRAMLVAEYYASSLAKDTCMSDVIQIAQSVDPFFVRTIARGPPSNTPVHYLATACVRCGHNANCIHAELEYIWSHGMQLPKLCKTCRLARRANVTVVHRVKRGGRVSLQSRGGRSVVGVSMF